jgi:hypothetical protein
LLPLATIFLHFLVETTATSSEKNIKVINIEKVLPHFQDIIDASFTTRSSAGNQSFVQVYYSRFKVLDAHTF